MPLAQHIYKYFFCFLSSDVHGWRSGIVVALQGSKDLSDSWCCAGSMHVISAVVDGRLLLRSRYYLLPLIDWVPIDACMVWIPILKYRVGEFCLMSSLFIH